MNAETKGTIGIIAQAEMAGINIAIMRRLRKVYGYQTCLYTSGVESVKVHQKFVDDGSLDEIVVIPSLALSYYEKDIERKAVFERASTIEAKIDCSFGQLFMARREFGIGFALGGVNHMLSPMAKDADYVRTLHAETQSLTFWESEIVTRNLVAILNGPKVAAVMARAVGIDFRWLYATRYKNYYYWSRNEFMEYPDLEETFRALPPRSQSVEIKGAYLQDVISRTRFQDKSFYVTMLRGMMKTILRRVRLILKGYLVGNEYYLTELLTYHWRSTRARIKARRQFHTRLEELKDLRFVYFPLQTEPEFSLQTMSPEYFFQLEAIASIARDLPAGVVLAVKESVYALGRRPRDFYRTLELIPNVVMLNMDEPGWYVATRADAVATISGTGGLEAAISGVPVLLFGRHCGYEFLDHVFPVERSEDVRAALRSALSPGLDRRKAALDGARLTDALEQISFDMGQFNTVRQDSFSEDCIALACERLVDGLSGGAMPARPVMQSEQVDTDEVL